MQTEKRWITAQLLFSAISEELASHRRASFTVTGMSMWPFLCHGRDQVILEEYIPGTLRKGDVVLLQTPLGNYLLHRVTRVLPDGFETTGDGNCFRDGRFPFCCIRARASAFVRKGKIIDCRSAAWRALFAVWMALFPVRRPLFLLWGHLRPYIRHIR